MSNPEATILTLKTTVTNTNEASHYFKRESFQRFQHSFLEDDESLQYVFDDMESWSSTFSYSLDSQDEFTSDDNNFAFDENIPRSIAFFAVLRGNGKRQKISQWAAIDETCQRPADKPEMNPPSCNAFVAPISDINQLAYCPMKRLSEITLPSTLQNVLICDHIQK